MLWHRHVQSVCRGRGLPLGQYLIRWREKRKAHTLHAQRRNMYGVFMRRNLQHLLKLLYAVRRVARLWFYHGLVVLSACDRVLSLLLQTELCCL